ncbi:MAG: YjdF family protein [Oscillospiraceae bacterium]|nr:YjdF family protein [Oscillospiraceae bacterium]
MASVTLTVFFDGQFWVGIYERIENEDLTVARVVYGAEPKDRQIHEDLLQGYYSLHFSPPVEGAKVQTLASNPKRRQRQVARTTETGIGTKSQQAMKLAQGKGKAARQARTKEQKEAEEQRRFELHVEKKKAKHRGH